MTVRTNIDDESLRQLIADILDVDEGAITDEVDFVENLGVDSLLALELAVAIERRYGLKIESHEMSAVRTMHEIRDLIELKTADRA